MCFWLTHRTARSMKVLVSCASSMLRIHILGCRAHMSMFVAESCVGLGDMRRLPCSRQAFFKGATNLAQRFTRCKSKEVHSTTMGGARTASSLKGRHHCLSYPRFCIKTYFGSGGLCNTHPLRWLDGVRTCAIAVNRTCAGYATAGRKHAVDNAFRSHALSAHTTP